MKKTSQDYLFTGIQMVLFLGFIFNPPSLIFPFHGFIPGLGYGFMLVGIPVCLLAIWQLNRKNLSPFPSPKAGSELIASGLYQKIRHPIYLGVLLTAAGFALATNSGFRLILTLLLFILFYFKSRYEEKRLEEKFPAYKNYKKMTGRFTAKW